MATSLRTYRLLKFATVGLVGTAVYYLLLWALVEVMDYPVLTASSVAFLLVAAENYMLHYVWTFASTNSHTSAFPKFLIMITIGFCLNWGIMYAGVEVLQANYLLVQAVSIAVVIAWNYVLSAFWIFGDRDGSE
jgi:putative flippase GtrA